MAKRGGIVVEVPLSSFGVLVAQLESIAASARQQPPDALLCFDLLSELVSAIEEEPKEAIVPWQRKCEDALYSLLVMGARRPVRRLASLAMARVIAKGDSISIYSRVSSLQGWLAEGKRSEPLSCAVLGELYRVFGRRITSGLTETSNIASKLMRFHEDYVRQDALLMLQNALEGSGGIVAGSDKAYNVRLAAAKCLKTFANIQGPGLGVPELENAAVYCTKGLDDPISSVRDAFAEALGAFLALGMNLDEQGALVQPRKLEGGVEKHLMLPFVRASGARAKDVRIGLTLSWVFFLQVIHLKYHLPDSELQDFALKAIKMLQPNSSVNAHGLACVLYILRVGVADQMTEPTQRSFLVLLCRQLESSDLIPSMGVAVLRMLSYLLTTLGQVPQDFKEILDNTVVAALSHSSIHMRVEASMTLRTLAEVDPTCVGGLISYGVTTLNALRESASIEKGHRLKFDLDSLHGQATVLAALVSISPRLRLGYPARLPKSVFEVSKKMLTESSRNPVAATVEKEAGWLLLASLISSMTKKDLEDQVFDILLLWAGPFVTNIDDYISEKQDLISEMRVLSAALEALTAFIKNFVSPKINTSDGGILLQPVLVYLGGALSYIRPLRARQVQSIKHSVDMFTLRTLMAYQSLLDPLTYKNDHQQIIEICTTPFSNPSGCEESSCLRSLLDKREAFLGPWIPGRDFLEDELRAFEDGNDGVLPCLWEDQSSSLPQSESAGKMLVNQMLLCLGSIFASQDTGGKLRLLNAIDQCLKSGRKQSWHGANVTNTCVVLLVGIKAVLASRAQILDNQILTSIQHIFQRSRQHREEHSSEGLGLLARLGNDSFTARMARSLLSDLTVAIDASYVGSLALSLGCIHRSAGGMALSSLVPATVSSISSLARFSNVDIQRWTLHSLLLIIEAAGLSYVSQVQATLSLAIDVLLAEENGLVDLRQGIGRLINAIVAVIGPELSPGSTFFSRCKSVVAETSSGQETSTLLESVRFTQQLVLFAPQAVSVHSHLQTLLPNLSSRQPTLRHLAVSTLRHLIEKDSGAVIEERIEENLFRMLDEETDSEIGNLVRATISRLLYKSCPSCPSRWLAICRSMALAISNGGNGSAEHGRMEIGPSNGNASSEGTAGLYYAEDDENMIASSTEAQTKDSISFGNSYLKKDKHLRYRTRLFAAECLSCLPLAVGTEPAHFDLSLARRRASSSDWLVLHLQELISLAYQISTSQFEGMQPIGVKLLLTIMDKFENIPDPELPGQFLVEQYQVQFVSAVRSAISISSDPSLLEAGLQLATKILTSSMLGGDQVSLQRMFSLISRPLDYFDDLYYPSFAEWVACEIKIRLLVAHASIKCYVYTLLRERKSVPGEYLQLIPLFSDTSSKLGKYWMSLLKDYSYISLGLKSKFTHKSFLDGIQSPLVSSRVKNCLDEIWPIILQAVDKSSEHITNDLAKQTSLSGHIMVNLELREFDHMWGLAQLILFQLQQPVLGSRETVLLGKSEQVLEKMKLFEISLITLQFLSSETFFNAEFLTVDLLKELLQVLLLSDNMAEQWNKASIPLFSKILQFCPGSFFDDEDFISLATELCIKYLCRTCLSVDSVSQDQTILGSMISEALCATERLLSQTSFKKHQKLKLALLSTCYKCVARTSTDSYLSKLIVFMRRIPTLFSKQFEGDAPNDDDACKIFHVWATMVSDLYENCNKKLHMLDKQASDPWKLLAKKLSFCLEDAIAVTRLAHETAWASGKEEIKEGILFSLYNRCIKCIKMALSDDNVKVQAISLLVLKNVVQKVHTEGSDAKARSFLLFFTGELLEEIFFLIQETLKKSSRKESMVVCEECLRFLFLFHTLAQGNECSQFSMGLLLEAIIMVFSASSDIHFEEVKEIKTTAMKLVSHLIQAPSTAAQIRDVLLSLPTAHRQLLQDIIRSSISQDQNPSHVNPSSPSLAIRPPVQSDATVRQIPLLLAPVPAPSRTHPEPPKEEILSDGRADDDDDDDWDTFQSLPATDGRDEVISPLTPSPVLERELQSSEGQARGEASDESKDEKDLVSPVPPMEDEDAGDSGESKAKLEDTGDPPPESPAEGEGKREKDEGDDPV
ncbi:unnamed protein product [Spirodela intermedia]|uniref:Uncharacterized protein n=1 Tax=Spirodela intermedia TaxID=51605 RepID=A0A7I8JK03_SPIIN|nr:unnamed protein product [Spirodela intermedia]CAA6670474.1 unnamed protein product [Spirodela intermedia]